ncbi:ATP-binding cassette domain-containing protein [Comamonadaceae bacterium G21597-S1]|nr:ATP-binding cassette domain-containing protein [Comamonadaceae bacterium G21597-S1]
MNIALETRGLTKSYGAVQALRGVDFTARQGAVTALCGDNGAGKSTLIRVLSGAHEPSSGAVLLAGKVVRFAGPHDALKQGIATIYQDLAVAPSMSIWQNIFMGGEWVRTLLPGIRILDKRAMRDKATALLTSLNQTVSDMDRPVSELSGGQRQAVAIARALLWQARIIIMDEPTAALGVKETAEVLALIGRLKDSGVTVILISHNMEDVVAVADHVVILKSGRKVAESEASGLSARALGQAILSGAMPAAV